MLPELTLEILQFLQEDAMTRFSSFPEVFVQLKPAHFPKDSVSCPSSRTALSASDPDNYAPLGTDGASLFVHPELLQQLFLSDTDYLRRCYLQLHIHCLCLHIFQSSDCSASDWDLACDLSAALFADLLHNQKKNERSMLLEQIFRRQPFDKGAFPTADVEKINESIRQARIFWKRTHWLTPPLLLPLLPVFPELQILAQDCVLDTHEYWYRPQTSILDISESEYPCSGSGSHGHTAASSPTADYRLRQLEQTLERWKHRTPHKLAESYGSRRGKAPGSVIEDAELQRRDSMNYQRFLSQFAVPREEAILDMDSFDYIPYYYGLACYGQEISAFTGQDAAVCHVPFLEPLEYKEVNRLDEFAIAIDTSASCSGVIVRRFLEETWSILRQRENFFSKIRIHLIQCDSMIQEHRIFTSVEEWEDAMQNIQIRGLGNTDFRPVFEYLERLISEGEIRQLRGLLYFTDGDGIFPAHAPAWDTAFVFLNKETEKREIPDWGIRLNLHLTDLDIAPIRDRI